MAKELFEISKFTVGTVTTPSENDIPEEAASYSLNIDCISEEGSLKGVPADDQLTVGTSSDNIAVNANEMAIIGDVNAGTKEYDLVYYDPSTNKVSAVTDLQSNSISQGTAISSTAESVTGTPSMIVNNKEVHIGMGSGTGNKPLWCGKISHRQFGGSVPTGLQLEDAELKRPSPFPLMHKIVNDLTNTYTYGIKENGNYIYKFEVSTGKFVSRSKHYFTATRAMCLSSDNNLWVVDNVSSALHLIKTDTEDMDVFIDVRFSGITTDMTDISEQGTFIWFAKGKSDGTIQTANWLYNKEKSSFVNGAGIQTLTDKTPYRGVAHTSGVTVANGTFIWSGQSNIAEDDQISIKYVVPSICLFTVNGQTDWVGVLTKITLDEDQMSSGGGLVDITTGRPRFYKDSNSKPAIGNFAGGEIVPNKGWVYLAIKSDYTTDAVLDGTYARLYPISLNVDTSVELGTFAHSVNQTAQSTYISIAFQHTTAAYTKLWVAMKVSLSSNSTLYGSTEQSGYSQATLHMDNAIISATGSKWNIFSKGDVAQWALKDGTSNATAFKQSQINFANFATNNTPSNNANHFPQFYAASFTYDGYQETPLSPWERFDPVNSVNQITFTLRIYASGLSKRITHVNIYRSNGTSDSQAVPTGFFRLVDTISTKYGWSQTAQAHTTPPWGNYYEKDYIDNREDGISYESRTGLPQVLESSLPNYGLSAELNSQLFIADCSHIRLEDSTSYLFKSIPYNYDQFNWIKDVLILPSVPTAMVSFMGRIFVFDKNNIYKIEPNNLYIEDTIEGIGCSNKNAVFVTDYGMCFADRDNIYLYDGSRVNTIGDSILRGDTYSWQNRDESVDTIVSFDSVRKSFLIFFKVDSGAYYCWAYNVLRKRWDLWDVDPSDPVKAAILAPDTGGEQISTKGSVLVSVNSLLKKYLGGNTLRNWSWTSKKLHMNQNTNDKKFYKVKILGTPSGALLTPGAVESLNDTTPDVEDGTGNPAVFEANQEHTNISQTSTTGSGTNFKCSISVNGSGVPTFTITAGGSYYSTGNTIKIVDPGSTSNHCLLTVSAITDDGVYAKIDNVNFTEIGSPAEFKIPGGNGKGKQIQVFLENQTSFVDAIGVVYRRLKVK